MQSILSFANSIIEPSSKQEQQKMDAPVAFHQRSSSSSRYGARQQLSSFNNTIATTQQQEQKTSSVELLQRSPAELGAGLAAILKSFLEFTPSQIQIEQRTKQNPFRLFCTEAPITLEAFGERLGTYFACSPVCFQVAAVYLGKAWAVHPEIFEPLSVFKLMLVALTVAVKFCEDRCSSQVHYARCGGIDVSELNFLESLFLSSLLKFEAFVKDAELQIAGVTLEKYCVAAEQSAASANNTVNNSREDTSMSSIPEDSMMDTTTEATTAAELGNAAPVAAAKTSSLRRTSHSSF